MQDRRSTFLYRYRYALIFVFFAIFYFVLSWHLVFNLHYAFGDAVTRTEKPFLVLYDNEPKLAALGFIWPPLPSLIQLPFIAMFKGIIIYGFAGKLVTVFFGALNVVLIYLFLERIRIRQGWKLLLTTLYALNPMIVFYAINGMSETTFLFFVIATAWHFYRWQIDKIFYHPLFIGIYLSLAFLTRYETFALTAAIGVLMFLTSIFSGTLSGDQEVKESMLKRLKEGVNITLFSLVPVITTIFLWMGVNWLIMGDPLHFFRGSYSASEQSNSIGGEPLQTSHNVVQTIWYSYKRIFLLFPLFSFLVIFTIMRAKKYAWLGISMVLLALSIPAFEIFVHYLGKSFGWLRFFIYIIPFSFVLLAIILGYRKKISNIVMIIIVVAIVISSGFSGVTMLNEKYGKEECASVRALIDNEVIKEDIITYDTDIKVVNYLKGILNPQDKVLIDDFLGLGILLNYGDPKIFINNSDREFDLAVTSPDKYADYILIPASDGRGISKLDIFNRTYPEMYNKGADYLTLIEEFDSRWRLYQVKNSLSEE